MQRIVLTLALNEPLYTGDQQQQLCGVKYAKA